MMTPYEGSSSEGSCHAGTTSPLQTSRSSVSFPPDPHQGRGPVTLTGEEGREREHGRNAGFLLRATQGPTSGEKRVRGSDLPDQGPADLVAVTTHGGWPTGTSATPHHQ